MGAFEQLALVLASPDQEQKARLFMLIDHCELMDRLVELQRQHLALVAVVNEMVKFDQRKPLPEMGNFATAVLALTQCLNTIGAIRGHLAGTLPNA